MLRQSRLIRRNYGKNEMASVPMIDFWSEQHAQLRLHVPIERENLQRERGNAVNLMVIGIVLATSAAAGELIASEEHLTQHGVLLWALIAGSAGMLTRIAWFEAEWCPIKLARLAITCLSTAVGVAPIATAGACRACQLGETSLALLFFVGWFVALSAPYLLTKYGQQVLDIVGSLGFARLKRELGDDSPKSP